MYLPLGGLRLRFSPRQRDLIRTRTARRRDSQCYPTRRIRVALSSKMPPQPCEGIFGAEFVTALHQSLSGTIQIFRNFT